MELKRHQSDLTETSKRALATNRGLQSETLKSTYETLENDFKSKCHTMNAEQLRFVRLIKTKLPAIKVHDETESSHGHLSPFSAKRLSPQMERKPAFLPPLVEPGHIGLGRRRSKSFSDLPQAVKAQEEQVQGKLTKRKSFEQLQGTKEENEQNKALGNRPRSHSNIEQPWNVHAYEREEEYTRFFRSPRKQSSPARLSPLDITDRSHETRKLTSKKPLGQQLKDVKDLRYLRTGKYTSESTVTDHGNQITGMKTL